MIKANRPPPPPIDRTGDAAPEIAHKECRTGPEIIADYVKTLSTGPGVYRMYGKDGELLYVGKARSLKNRVSNYARFGGHTNRIALMISLTRSMEFVLTRTETEALLLEANLIKRLKPRFNILLRDDKSFPYILIKREHEAAQLTKHRGARKAKGEYFGPFANASAVNQTLNTLQKAFGIRTCSDNVYEGRTRPCMLYQIKRCAGPCVDLISAGDYNALVEEAVDFMSGRSNALRERLQADMLAASENLGFETAAKLRDRIRAIAAVTSRQDVNTHGVKDTDVIALHQEGGKTCVQIFFFRAGQNWGNRALYPRHGPDVTPGEITSTFIAQFYDDKPAPRKILTSVQPEQIELLTEALTLRAGYPVEIRTPKRGHGKVLVEAAYRNAREALGRSLAESRSWAKLLDGVASVFDLDNRPQRIEVYDNSHIQGTNALGAMIVAGPDGFEKSGYRRFNMKGSDAATHDDFAMMRIMLRRRFIRLQKERDKGSPIPDLVLIDGGKGQLSAVMAVMEELGIRDITVAAVAKGPDRNAGQEVFYTPGKPPIRLPVNDPVLYYLQRIRDEAHRFAITGHRAKRTRQMKKNPLDDIPGVGAARKSALLKHFGSARAVTRANLGDLEAVNGISKSLALKIYEHFHE